MFSQQHNIPKQHYRVEHYPDIAELKKFVDQAESIKGVKHCFCWREQEVKKTLTISILFAVKGGGDPEWWMHEDTEFGPRMLWFYRSRDLSIIYPQVLEAVGAPNPFKDEQQQQQVIGGSLTDRLGNISQRYATPGATGPAPPTPPSNRPPLAKLLSGTLEQRSFSAILQTAHQEDATGKLIVESPMGEGVVFFMHGVPEHATTPNQTGVEALIELFTWPQGKVIFNQGTKNETISIQQSVEQILYRGAQLIENIAFLQENGINELSQLRRVPAAITEKEFEKRILEGPPLGLDLQKTFFQNVDGSRSLQDIATFLSLAPSQWVAICVNLLRLGMLITPDGKSIQFTLQSQTLSGPTPPGQPPIPPQGQFGRSSDHQAITGSFSRNPPPPNGPSGPTGSTSGSWNTQPGNTSGSWNTHSQSNSGTFTTGGQSTSGSFNSSGQPTPPMPPANVFSGGMPPAASSGANVASPAVEAFLTASTTLQDLDTIHIGIQTNEVKTDKNAIKAVYSALCEKETGILTFEALQFFLDREMARSFRQGSGFSLIVFSIKLRSETRRTMLASKVVALIVNAINKIKHDVDIMGHFGEKGYAIIVPNASSSQAGSLVDKITTNLTKFAPELSQNRPNFYFGIASAPNDAQDIDTLIANAHKAMLEASKRNITRVQFGDL
jgi:FOG: GGDEF domain